MVKICPFLKRSLAVGNMNKVQKYLKLYRKFEKKLPMDEEARLSYLTEHPLLDELDSLWYSMSKEEIRLANKILKEK